MLLLEPNHLPVATCRMEKQEMQNSKGTCPVGAAMNGNMLARTGNMLAIGNMLGAESSNLRTTSVSRRHQSLSLPHYI